MINFINRNKNKFVMIVVLGLVLIGLTGCRVDSANWYGKPYQGGWTGYGQEFRFDSFWAGLWGWPVSVLSWPIAFICSTIGKALGNSFFWGILFTTLIVRTLAWPIYSKQNSMSLKMTLMNPELNKIQKKYAGRQDPQSQQKMQMEMMKLYKKYKVNPLGCLLPMFIQFPIFMAMYECVQRINSATIVNVNGIEILQYGPFALQNTKVFNFFELNTSFFEATAIQDKIFALVLAVGFGALNILSQKLASKKPSYMKEYANDRVKTQQQLDQEKQMKMMSYVMTGMFVVMSLSSTSLALYWLIGAIYQLFQSFVGRKLNEHNYKKAQEKDLII